MASISLYVVISINKRSRRFSKIPSVSHITSSIGTIEVCLSDIDSAMTAVNAGANSIELCSDRSGGGVTPSMGLILQCVDRFNCIFRHLSQCTIANNVPCYYRQVERRR